MKTLQPIFQALSFTASGQAHRASRIAHLLGPRRPSNVSRFVMTVVVLAIERILRRWPAAYLAQKMFKTLKAKFYASASVARELCVDWVRAAVFCTQVSFVLGRALAAAFFTVRVRTRALQASTRYRLAYVIGKYFFDGSAVAPTQPPVLASSRVAPRQTNDGKAAGSESIQVANRWSDRFIVAYFGGLQGVYCVD